MFTTAKNKIKTLAGCTLLCTIFLLQACPIVAVAIIAAYNDDGGITVTVEIPKSAPTIFEAAKKRLAKGVSETGIPYKVTSIDEDNYTISVEGTDGSWGGDFIIVPISAGRSQVIGQGSDKERTKHESEYLILLGIENLCKDLDVNYTVIGRRMGGGTLD